MRTNNYIKAEDWVPIAEKIAKRNGGKLPRPQAIIDKVVGGWALYQQMRRKPLLFAHIKRS